ncbi:MAG: hypothetical protein JWR43_453, partial [Phenylobacterium sp.]|nr:hypothetical protein [Phenylobacterium sp.]
MTGAADDRESALLPLTAFAFGLLGAAAWGCVAFYFGTAHGHLDFALHAVGRDFVNIWTAAHLAAEGRVLEVFQPRAFLA